MDADSKTRRRDRIISRRRSRWSMNSQRLEQIVAELMKPISDARKSFDTDLSALLEEYLTEAGLHALDAEDSDVRVAPNFAELAMLLQQSASIYGRKVDFLYQNVLLVSESLNNSTLELEAGEGEGEGEGGEGEAEAEAGRRGRARRRAPSALGFEYVALQGAAAARRSGSPPRAPPPTLPRVYIELEPASAAESLALRDHAGEPLGALREYRAAWRLRDGRLLEGEGAAPAPPPAPPIPLCELRAALAAASPPCTSTPLVSPPPGSPPPGSPAPGSPPPPETPVMPRKKRRSDINIDDLSGGFFKILIKDALAAIPLESAEFSLEKQWVDRVIERRKLAILAVRRRMKLHALHPTVLDFRGFEVFCEAGGFRGWSAAEGAAAAAAVAAAATDVRAHTDIDSDDGFFEQSAVEPEGSPVSVAAVSTVSAGEAGAEWARRVACAAELAPPAPDVRALAGAVLGALEGRELPWAQLAARARHHKPSHVLLATLFLANAGNVRIERAAPRVAAFAVRLLSTDAALYAAETEAAFTPAPTVAPPPR